MSNWITGHVYRNRITFFRFFSFLHWKSVLQFLSKFCEIKFGNEYRKLLQSQFNSFFFHFENLFVRKFSFVLNFLMGKYEADGWDQINFKRYNGFSFHVLNAILRKMYIFYRAELEIVSNIQLYRKLGGKCLKLHRIFQLNATIKFNELKFQLKTSEKGTINPLNLTNDWLILTEKFYI